MVLIIFVIIFVLVNVFLLKYAERMLGKGDITSKKYIQKYIGDGDLERIRRKLNSKFSKF